MNAWYFYCGVLLVFPPLAWLERSHHRGASILTAALLMFVFCGSVQNGADWIGYINDHSTVAASATLLDAVSDSNFESGFASLSYLIGSFTADNQWLFAVCGMISAIGWVIFIRKNTPRLSVVWASLFLILSEGWVLYNEQIRQAVAVTIGLGAYVRWRRQQRWLALAAVVLATMFHRSAIFELILLWLSSRLSFDTPLRRVVKYIFGITSLIVAATLLYTMAAAFGIIGYFSEAAAFKASQYLEDETFNHYILTIGLVSNLVGIILVVLSYDAVARSRNKSYFDAWLFTLCWCILSPVMRINGGIVRFEHYFLIFSPVLCVFIFEKAREGGRAHFKLSVAAACGLALSLTFFLRILLNPDQHVWVQRYQNVFVYAIIGKKLEQSEARGYEICSALADSGNQFCINNYR